MDKTLPTKPHNYTINPDQGYKSQYQKFTRVESEHKLQLQLPNQENSPTIHLRAKQSKDVQLVPTMQILK